MKNYIQSVILFFKVYPVFAISFFMGGYFIGLVYF